MPKRIADAVWNGSLIEGNGRLHSVSGAIDADYNWTSRAGDGGKTNPEELIAAAHAGCFTMALAFRLQNAGATPESLRTEARLSMEQEEGGWRIAAVALTLRARVPGVAPEQFLQLAEEAKANCPVSRVLNAQITLEATLE